MTPYQAGPKPVHRSKTLWTAAGSAAAAAGILVAEYHWPGMFGPELKAAAVTMLGAALVFGALRFKTAGPVSTK